MIILAKGTIDIKSKEGEGTSVILIIPDRAGEKNG
jgi:signal transduction histidine kinase